MGIVLLTAVFIKTVSYAGRKFSFNNLFSDKAFRKIITLFFAFVHPILTMPPITIFNLPTATTPLHLPSVTPYNPIAIFQSNHSSSDTIQTITFGVLGILFAAASVFLAYLHLRHMPLIASMQLSTMQLTDQTGGMPLVVCYCIMLTNSK